MEHNETLSEDPFNLYPLILNSEKSKKKKKKMISLSEKFSQSQSIVEERNTIISAQVPGNKLLESQAEIGMVRVLDSQAEIGVVRNPKKIGRPIKSVCREVGLEAVRLDAWWDVDI